jgi:hypothetical protein
MRTLLLGFLFASCSSSSSGPAPITQAACGTTIVSHVGATIEVSLDSTYWMFQPVSNATVLEQSGNQVTTPSGNCMAGVGCGTARAVFEALGEGQSTINATRASCGEGVGCTPAQGSGNCNITVTVGQ